MSHKRRQNPIECGAERVLLHTCCAPCSAAIIEALLANGIRPTLFYSNSNIAPYDEYLRRRDECYRYARQVGVDMIDPGYDHQAWLADVAAGMEHEPERGARCLKCFISRLGHTARFAADNGFRVITTSLASSRWKSLEQINQAGQIATEGFPSVNFWDQNWRRGGLTERRAQLLRLNNFYNQPYCGCEFSFREPSPSK